MDFLEIARARQSCRSYDTERPVEQKKLDAVLEAARLAPSACNAQPYHFTVCRGQAAKAAVDYAARAVIHAAFPSFPVPARSAGR